MLSIAALIAATFAVSESFFYKLLRQRRATGEIAPLPHGGGTAAKLDDESRWRWPTWWANNRMPSSRNCASATRESRSYPGLRSGCGFHSLAPERGRGCWNGG